MATIRCGCAYGSGRRITASITQNTAVATPTPSASVNTTVSANPGARRICRIAYWMSWRIMAASLRKDFL